MAKRLDWEADAKRKLAKGPTPKDRFMDLRASRWLEVVETRKAEQTQQMKHQPTKPKARR